MFITTPRDFGTIIREVRRQRGMSQTDLARQLNTSQGWVSETESGKPTAEIGMVLKAMAVLGISLNAQTEHGPTVSPSDTIDDDDLPPYKL